MRRGRYNDRTRLYMALAGIVTLLGLVGLMAIALTAQRGLPLAGYYTLHADFRDAGEIEEYSDVRIAGKLVGQVTDASYGNGLAHLTLQLSPGTGPLRSSTTARIRLQGLLGAKYIDVVPGASGRELPNGTTIPVSRTSTTVDLFHVLESFDARRRYDLQQMLDALGEGFLDRGPGLNGALAAAPAVTANMNAIATAVIARPGAAARLTPAAESMSAALDPVRAQMAHGFEPQARSLEPFVQERAATQAIFTIAPSALPVIRTGLARSDPLLAQTAGFARATVALTRVAPAALRQATELLRAAPGPLRATDPMLRTLAGSVPPTLRFTDGVDPLITPSISSFVHQLPLLDAIANHACDVIGYAYQWRSLLGYGQAGSNPIGFSNFVMIGTTLNPTTPPGSPQLTGTDIYPRPCAAVNDHAG